MDIRVIVFGMCFVLIGLFVVANIYIPKAKEKSLKEAEYGIAAQEFLRNPTEDSYAVCVNKAAEFIKATHSTLTVDEFLNRENIIFQKH